MTIAIVSEEFFVVALLSIRKIVNDDRALRKLDVHDFC